MTPHVIRWIAFVVALGAFFLAAWIIVPAPTYFLLTFGVGAREVSAWIAVASIAGIGLAATSARDARLSQLSIALCVVSFALALSPFVRLPATVTRFDREMRAMSVEPFAPLRRKPLIVADLFRGIPLTAVVVTRRVQFANPGGVPLALDIYRPPMPARAPGGHPILVQIYGGAWQRGAPSDNAEFATWAADAGYVVFAIDYRHAPAVRWPALLDDVDSSLVWIRDHAAQYDADTSRVVLMGRSAGGHLALMAAYSSPPLNIRGVISFYGPAELVDAYRHPPRPDPLDVRATMDTLFGGTLDQMPDRYAAASPASFATRPQPPTLLVYGGADHIVQAKYGALLRDTLAAAHSPVAYLEIPWAEHAFDAVFNGPSSQVSLYYVERFLAWATARSESSP